MRGNISVFNIVKSMSKQKQSTWILKQLLWRKEEKGDIAKIKMTMFTPLGSVGGLDCGLDVPMFLNPFYMYLPGIEINRIQRSELENIGQCGQWSGSLTNFYLNFIILSKNHFEIYAPYVNRSLIGKPFYLFRQHKLRIRRLLKTLIVLLLIF